MRKYPEYKDSGIEWIGEIPANWELCKIKYSSYVKGRIGWQGLKSSEFIDNGFAFLITGMHFKNNSVDWTSCYQISENRYNQSPEIHIRQDDLLITKDGTIGKLAYINHLPGKATLNSHILVIRPIHNQFINRFLFWVFHSDTFKKYVDMTQTGTTFYGITQEKLEEFLFPIPSLNSQHSINDFLNHKTSQIDSLIEKKKRLIELLKEYRTAIINHAVTKGLDPNAKMKDSGIEWIGEIPEHWEVLKIKRLSPVGRGASPRPIDDPKYFDDEGEYSWVRISDVTASNRYLLSTRQKLSTLGSSLSVKLKAGDFFLSIAGSVGKPIITKIKCCIHDGFVWFPKLQINNEFLYYIFETGEPYKGLGKWGTQLNLNTETVGDIHIPVPPDYEIEMIVSFLDTKVSNILKTTDALSREVDSLLEFRTSLISDAVTGKVDVREYAERVSKPGVT